MISENSINIARDSASTETKLSPGKLEKKTNNKIRQNEALGFWSSSDHAHV